MSTRSHTFIRVGGKPVLSFNRHQDGYPAGHGRDLASALKDAAKQGGVLFYGAPLFALLADLNSKANNIFLTPEVAGDVQWIYTVEFSDAWNGPEPTVSVVAVGVSESAAGFYGTIPEFVEWTGTAYAAMQKRVAEYEAKRAARMI